MTRAAWRNLLLGVAGVLLAIPAAGPVQAAPLPPDRLQQANTIEIDGPSEVIVGRPFEMEFRARNATSDANQGSITVSIAGGPTIEIVRASVGGAKIYQPGEMMYDFGQGRSNPIRVPAAEVFASSWPAGTQHTLRLRITASAPITVQARASFRRANGSFVHMPSTGPNDQQGAPSRLIDITPIAPGAPAQPPPTAAPPPTQRPIATTAPPTATPRPAEPPTAAPPTARPDITRPPGTSAPPPNTAGPAPAQTQQTVPPAPPLGAGGQTPAAPTPSATTASSSRDGNQPAMPLLLAGIGIMVLGLGVGVLALILVLRRKKDAPPPVYQGYPVTPYPGTPYPGQVQPGPYGGGTPPGPYGGHPGPYPTPAPPHGQPPAPWDQPAAPRAPWEQPANPTTPWSPPTPAPPPPWEQVSPTTHDLPPTPAYESPTRRDEDSTPRPASVGRGGPSTPSGERYTQRTLVGRGGMGSVYRAYDSRLRRWVALKIMHSDLGLQPGFMDRFIREAQVAAMLEHPNIVAVHDIEQVGREIQMVMSWVDGDDLQKILEKEGALLPLRAAQILDQVAAALDHAHLRDQPVLHRDIKPSNIMVTPTGRVILTDFGIARLMGDVSLTQTGQVVGTPAFMAPEVVEGAEADRRADVYALGVVLFQMVTGRAPFHAETPLALLHAQIHTPPPAPRSITPTLPPAVDAVLLKALAKNPRERYQTAGELARAFRAAIGHGA